MPNIFIVMGNARAGKSTTIRSLTGLGHSRKIWRIRTESNEDINVYVLINALQEDSIIKTVDELLERSNRCENILVALKASAKCVDLRRMRSG
jgi:ABC-type methionine transport system ATPase subunit